MLFRSWDHVQMYHLHQNMHLEQSPEMQEFAMWLLNVGAGEGLDNSECITIPHHMQCHNHTLTSLIQDIYPDIAVNTSWTEISLLAPMKM